MTAKAPSQRLGRGLAALLGEAATKGGLMAEGIRQVPLDLLDPGPFQPRGAIDPAALAELADSIRARGILQPLLARPSSADPGRFQIIAGERRWRAASLAGLHEVPVLVRELTDSEAMAAALVENLQRQDLNPLEEAEGYNRLLDEFGMTQEALAQAVGKSRPHIGNTLRLLNLTPGVQAALRAGTVTAGHARALLAHPVPDAALALVVGQGLSVRQTEALVARQGQPERASSKARTKDPDTLALERDVTAQLGLRVEIVPANKGGQVRISYRDLDQLDGLVRLLCDGKAG